MWPKKSSCKQTKIQGIQKIQYHTSLDAAQQMLLPKFVPSMMHSLERRFSLQANSQQGAKRFQGIVSWTLKMPIKSEVKRLASLADQTTSLLVVFHFHSHKSDDILQFGTVFDCKWKRRLHLHPNEGGEHDPGHLKLSLTPPHNVLSSQSNIMHCLLLLCLISCTSAACEITKNLSKIINVSCHARFRL